MEPALLKSTFPDRLVDNSVSLTDYLPKKLLQNVLYCLFGVEILFQLYEKFASSFLLLINSKLSFHLNEFVMSRNAHTSGYPIDRSDSGFRPDDFDEAMKENFDSQEKIASSMLEMTRSLKASTMAANQLIKRDVQKLNQAKNAVDGNVDALKQTSEKLSTCTRNSVNWSLIALVVLVFMIFMFMVFLMRVMKKN